MGGVERANPIPENLWNYGVLGPKATMSLDCLGNRTGIGDSEIPKSRAVI
jgi:hypothetical protein